MAPSKHENKRLTIKALNIYPIKSCRGITLQSTTLTRQGLLHDRKWMFVDSSKQDSNRFMTIRERAELTLINTAIDETDQTLVVTFPDLRKDTTGTPDDITKRQFRVPLTPTEEYLAKHCKKIEVSIWYDNTDAYAYASLKITNPIDRFFSSLDDNKSKSINADQHGKITDDNMNTKEAKRAKEWTPGTVQFVMKGPTKRIVAGNGAPDQLGRTETVNFPDVLPILVATEESLRELNRRIQDKGENAITIERFRPNVVVSSQTSTSTSTPAQTRAQPEIVVKDDQNDGKKNKNEKNESEGGSDESKNTLEPWEEDRWTLLRFNPLPPTVTTTTTTTTLSSSPSPSSSSLFSSPFSLLTSLLSILQTLLATVLTLLGLPWLIPYFLPSTSSLTTFPPIDTDVSARCTRCHVPNVDPSTAIKHDSEPWSTLYSYRRVDSGFKYKPCFGMLCCPRSRGGVRVGGEVEVRGYMGEGKEHVYIKAF